MIYSSFIQLSEMETDITAWFGLLSTGCSHYGRDEMGFAMIVLLATLLVGQRRRQSPNSQHMNEL